MRTLTLDSEPGNFCCLIGLVFSTTFSSPFLQMITITGQENFTWLGIRTEIRLALNSKSPLVTPKAPRGKNTLMVHKHSFRTKSPIFCSPLAFTNRTSIQAFKLQENSGASTAPRTSLLQVHLNFLQ